MCKGIGAEKDAEVPEIQVPRKGDAVGRGPSFGLVVDVETVAYEICHGRSSIDGIVQNCLRRESEEGEKRGRDTAACDNTG